MALKIVWTLQAKNGLEKTIAYLEKKWTIKEILSLEQHLKEFTERISKYPKIYPKTGKYKNTHRGLVDKNNYIVYRLKPEREIIEFINYRGTRQKPKD